MNSVPQKFSDQRILHRFATLLKSTIQQRRETTLFIILAARPALRIPIQQKHLMNVAKNPL